MHKLPELKYSYDALEPVIDSKTMEIHHSKHHATYVNKLNDALSSSPELLEKSVEELLSDFESLPEGVKNAVRNHGGGHANHSLFWEILTPGGAKSPSGKLLEAINAECTDFETFKKHFQEKTAAQFGSGWGWLVKNSDGGVEIITTPNQDSPLLQGLTPIFGVDVWEHAYYLKHQSDRAAYLQGIWDVINWDKVSALFTGSNN